MFAEYEIPTFISIAPGTRNRSRSLDPYWHKKQIYRFILVNAQAIENNLASNQRFKNNHKNVFLLIQYETGGIDLLNKYIYNHEK